MSELEQEQLETEPPRLFAVGAPVRARSLERSFGLIAGILFIGGALAGIPSSMLIEPAPPASLYLVSVASIASGLAAMTIPWDRVSSAWTHVAMLVAIVEVGFAVALAGDPFVFYFVFIAIFAAYAFSDRSQVAVYLGLIAVALLLPILVIPDATRASAAQALAAMPAIALVAVMVAFLRERLEANRATTRRFAREALALSERIGRLPAGPPPVRAPRGSSPALPHPLWRRVGIAGSAALGVVVAAGTMTAAGVAMPSPIENSFASVGIEPPSAPNPVAVTTAVRAQKPTNVGTASRSSDGPKRSPAPAKHRGHREHSGNKHVHRGDGASSQPAAKFSAGQADASSSTTPSATASAAAPQPAVTPPADDAADTVEQAAPQTPSSPVSVPTPDASSPDKTPAQELGDQIGSLVDGLLGNRPSH